MTTSSRLSPDACRFLRTRSDRYPYAYGYLTSLVRSYLDGLITRERLETVLGALEQELRGEPR